MGEEFSRIIEFDVLSGIDKAFHALTFETNHGNFSYTLTLEKSDEMLKEDLKKQLSDYVEMQFKIYKSRINHPMHCDS